MHFKTKTKVSFLWPGATFIILTVLHFVSCDISIIDRVTNQVEFQTASEFIGNSKCGSFDNKNPGIIVDPGAMSICWDPIQGPPISRLDKILYALQGLLFDQLDLLFGTSLNEKFPEPSWLLMVPAEGTCSLHRKLKNAQIAGYSAVILTTNNPKKVILADLNAAISKVKDKTTLEFHLINPWDVKVLSKYTYASSGRRYRLVENIPLITRNTDGCRPLPRDYSILYSWVTSYWTWWLSIAATSIVGLFFVKKIGPILAENEQARQPPPRFNVPPPRFNANPPPRQRRRPNPQPPPPPPPPRRPVIDIGQIIRDHLTCLDLPHGRLLTCAQVISAYRRKAREHHPDRHPPEARQQQDEKMKEINKARDFLLPLCIDRYRNEE